MCVHIFPGGPQRIGLCLTPALSDGLREVSKQNRKPKDDGDCQSKAARASFMPKSDTTHKTLVRIAETNTKNMTGFSAWVLGLNLMNESLIALPSIF